MKEFSNYEICLYTEYIFGKGVEQKAGELIKKYGGSKALVVFGGNSVKTVGALDKVLKSLSEVDVTVVEFPGVQPNPRRSHVNKGLEIAKAEGIDFILAVGGGSVIDTAKAISVGALSEDYWFDHWCKTFAPFTKRLPLGVVLTAAASGSETSMGSVIKDDISSGMKYGFGGPNFRPDFALLNPEFTYSVPAYQTSSGTADIFAHALERYFHYHSDCALSDGFTEAVLKNVVKYGPIAYRGPNNYEARAELMISSSFAHNDITSVGNPGGMNAGPHALEEPVGGVLDSTHGAGLAVLMPHWMEFIVDNDRKGAERVAKLAVHVFGADADFGDVETVAKEGIRRFRAWLKDIGMPQTLGEMGATEASIEKIMSIEGLFRDGMMSGFIPMTKEQVKGIYMDCL